MHQETLQAIVEELKELLPGRFLGKVFQLSPTSLAIDFQLRQNGSLYLSVDPASPRLHLIKRTVRELERQSSGPSTFVQAMRAALRGATVLNVTKDDSERIVRFQFSPAADDLDRRVASMVAQLTGRSANLLLLAEDGAILQALRRPQGVGQQINEPYAPPPRSSSNISKEPNIERGDFETFSEAVDDYYRRLDAESEFTTAANRIKEELAREIRKQEKLLLNLRKDLSAHGDPEEHKRLGDLLLANLTTAKRSGDKVTILDYFADEQPAVELTIDENKSLPHEAADAFSRYGKAKRGAEEIARRLTETSQRMQKLKEKRSLLADAINRRDEKLLVEFASKPNEQAAPTQSKPRTRIPGTRSYRSSDGYEVLVGKAARDNDNLTFRIARPNDLWLHAGDYPGSHVIVRNPGRREVPQRTVIEAAQLAAKFSQASNDAKVTIHYTPRKFLSKPKGAAPGLVRMSSFKSITVQPAENIERLL